MRRAFLLASLTTACGHTAADGPAAAGTTFARLQKNVFEPSCAFSSCHSAAGKAGNLVLTGNAVYSNLVGVRPASEQAVAAGMLRVVPGDPQRSQLWHKLSWAAGHHAMDLGELMPEHGPPLTVEQVEFVRRWIEAGAKSTGDDIDPALLAGTTAQAVAPYVPLAPPTQGVQLKVAPFTVPPHAEREVFVYTSLGNVTDLYVTKIEMQMRTGSHHLLSYTMAPDAPALAIPVPGQVRDLHNSDGSINFTTAIAMPYHVFFAGSMTPRMTYEFPAGVALRVPAAAAHDLNAHYVNAGNTPITGEAEINYHTVPAAQVGKAASTLFWNNTSISIPKGRDTTITKTFKVSATTTVFALSSHMHARGTRFVIRISGGARNGEVVYENTDWEHPAIVTYATPIVLKAGEGLTSSVTFHGDPSKVVTFGLTSDDEMDIIFGYWY